MWDQRPAAPIEPIPPDRLQSINAPFRWAFVGPMSTDDEADACTAATPRLNLLLEAINTLREDGVYQYYPEM